jgi:hypothetical protein
MPQWPAKERLLRAADWALEERNAELAASWLAALPQGAAQSHWCLAPQAAPGTPE